MVRRMIKDARNLWMMMAMLAVAPAAAQDSESSSQKEHPLVPAMRLAHQSYEKAKELKDYEAKFTKAEMVRGRMYSSQMAMKFRQEPFSVYLLFTNPKHAGREVLFVEGQNSNKMLAHDTGLRALAGTVSIDPHSQMALSEARHPITRIGMAKMAEAVYQQWEKESKFGECEVKYYPEAKLGGREVLVIESTHPRPRNQFPFAITRLWIDKKTKLPVRVQSYAFPRRPDGEPVLVEDYTYTNIHTNVGLTDRDFDPRNSAYSF